MFLLPLQHVGIDLDLPVVADVLAHVLGGCGGGDASQGHKHLGTHTRDLAGGKAEAVPVYSMEGNND